MALQEERPEYEAVPPQQAEEDDQRMEEEEGVKEASGFCTSQLKGILVVCTGTVLYSCILYILALKLVYPASFSPFMKWPAAKPNFSDNATTADSQQLAQALLTDAALLCLFVFQHSLMARPVLKRWFEGFGMLAIVRPLYVLCTCITINVMYNLWQATPTHVVWWYESWIASSLLRVVHVVGWLSISGSVFTLDYLELLGIKQIYYSYYNFDNPLAYKSAGQQHLLHHMRHPIFVAPVLILWAVPILPYDRLLVAVMLPAYLYWASSLDQEDYEYVTEQFDTKRNQLLNKVNSKLD